MFIFVFHFYFLLTSLVFQIDNLETSIAALKKEIYVNDDDKIMTRLDIAFMTGSSYDFKRLKPSTLPSVAASIDVWILRGQDICIIIIWGEITYEILAINLCFHLLFTFTDNIKTIQINRIL